jgi:hypothetical protein
MASSYVLATLYTNANYAGSSLVLQASTPCDTNADVDHSWATLPAGFADEVSSFRGANNCQVKLFEHTNYGGTSLVPLVAGHPDLHHLRGRRHQRQSLQRPTQLTRGPRRLKAYARARDAGCLGATIRLVG